MGSGKTTVGRLAASRVGVRFYDTDEMVVEISRMAVRDIWEGVGEEGFRELERRAVARVPESGCIAAAGGGAVLDAANREHMTRGRPVVWLECPPDVLASRLADDASRPLLADGGSPEDRLASLLAERREIYSEVATHTVETADSDVDATVESVVEIWQS